MKRNSSSYIKQKAKQLRKELTPAEKYLWSKIRAGQLNGYHVRKQYPIGSFVVDFFISELNLVIELDGESHNYNLENEKLRENYIINQGFRIIRFQNQEVFNNIEGVIENIIEFCNKVYQPPSNSPRTSGGEHEES